MKATHNANNCPETIGPCRANCQPYIGLSASFAIANKAICGTRIHIHTPCALSPTPAPHGRANYDPYLAMRLFLLTMPLESNLNSHWFEILSQNMIYHTKATFDWFYIVYKVHFFRPLTFFIKWNNMIPIWARFRLHVPCKRVKYYMSAR